LRISVFYNRKFKKIREIAGFIPNPLRFHGKTESEGRRFVETGTGKNKGFPEQCALGGIDSICFRFHFQETLRIRNKPSNFTNFFKYNQIILHKRGTRKVQKNIILSMFEQKLFNLPC
jgi:hypothetical protein